MDKLSYRCHRFPSIVIQQAVWLYFRFALSYRDVEDMLAERGIDVSYETVRRWALKFGGIIARKLRGGRPRPDGRWHLDEVFVSINGRQLYVWRAVDSEGEVLDILVQPRRDRKAALKLMRKLLKKQGVTPACIVMDKLVAKAATSSIPTYHGAVASRPCAGSPQGAREVLASMQPSMRWAALITEPSAPRWSHLRL